MKTVIKLLKKELRMRKQQYAEEKAYWKGSKQKLGKKDLADSERHIASIKEAIKILKERETRFSDEEINRFFTETGRKRLKAIELYDSILHNSPICKRCGNKAK